MIEITFNSKGNTIVGEYGPYSELDKAMARKSVIAPDGLTVSGEASDIRRLADYILTFGNCIKSPAAFRHTCKLAEVQIQ